MHTRHTEIIWLKVSNENLPCEHLCGGNKSISSQLIILRFGTVSNTTEYYTTVFESDDQVGIWKLEFLTLNVCAHAPIMICPYLDSTVLQYYQYVLEDPTTGMSNETHQTGDTVTFDTRCLLLDPRLVVWIY